VGLIGVPGSTRNEGSCVSSAEMGLAASLAGDAASAASEGDGDAVAAALGAGGGGGGTKRNRGSLGPLYRGARLFTGCRRRLSRAI